MAPTEGWLLSLKFCDTGKDDSGGSDVSCALREPAGPASTFDSTEKSLSWPMVGGTHTSLRRVHAEQGQVFVVAASHLIFRFLQPLQARITIFETL